MSRAVAAPRPMKVVTVNTADLGGGAERIAGTLVQGFQQRGLESWLIVGDKKTADPQVVSLFHSPHFDYRQAGYPGSYRLNLWLKRLDRLLGIEDFRSPFSKHLPLLTGSPPDVIHCHNLHGGFFDLRVLPELSRRKPVWLTLHDCWWLTGHCAYPFDCTRWQSGCGACPHLDTPPALQRDGTRRNWRRKRDIYAGSRLRVAAGSRWLLDQVAKSMLAPAIVESRLIRYGVDLNVFRPGCRASARQHLGIPLDAQVVLFVAHQPRNNPFKDFATMRAALVRVAEGIGNRPIHFYCVGEAAPDEVLGRLRIRHIAYQASAEQLARYFRAADLYLHAAKSEVLGLVIVEGMACGIPVVATRVGGIPETFVDRESGLLVPPADPVAMAEAVGKLLAEPELGQRLGARAAERARLRFNQETMVDEYVGWFREIVSAQPAAA